MKVDEQVQNFNPSNQEVDEGGFLRVCGQASLQELVPGQTVVKKSLVHFLATQAAEIITPKLLFKALIGLLALASQWLALTY